MPVESWRSVGCPVWHHRVGQWTALCDHGENDVLCDTHTEIIDQTPAACAPHVGVGGTHSQSLLLHTISSSVHGAWCSTCVHPWSWPWRAVDDYNNKARFFYN